MSIADDLRIEEYKSLSHIENWEVIEILQEDGSKKAMVLSNLFTQLMGPETERMGDTGSHCAKGHRFANVLLTDDELRVQKDALRNASYMDAILDFLEMFPNFGIYEESVNSHRVFIWSSQDLKNYASKTDILIIPPKEWTEYDISEYGGRLIEDVDD